MWSIFTEEDSHQVIIGASVFLVLLVTNVFLALSKLSMFLISIIWRTFITTSLWLAIILVIAFLVCVYIFGLPAVIKLLKLIFKGIKSLSMHLKNKSDDGKKELKEKVEEIDKFMAGMKG
jgi:hypothetical protein